MADLDRLPDDLGAIRVVVVLLLVDLLNGGRGFRHDIRGFQIQDLGALCLLGNLVDQVARFEPHGRCGLTWVRASLEGRCLDVDGPGFSVPVLACVRLGTSAATAASAPAPPAPRRGLILGCLLGACAALLGGLLLQQRLPVGDRDLVIVGMNFGEGQEAVAIAAIVDEGRLQRRLHARHLGEIDIAPKLLLGR